MNFFKKNKELLFVKFPFMFPIIYGVFLYAFPGHELYLIFFTILILAEPHFGATWPFFLNRINKPYINENKILLVYIPILVALFSLIGFILINKIFLLIFFAANVYHVTRQSYGICKLYCINNSEIKFQEVTIYLVNFVFFLIAFFRFYSPMINESNIVLVNVLVSLTVLVIFLIYIIKFKFSENFLTFVTGCMIFSPVCFVSNPVHAIIMGVTMHYSQYLVLTFEVFSKREQEIYENNSPTFLGIKNYKYIITIILYGAIMAVLSLYGKFDISFLKSLIIISIIGQMLHFYLDSQLWKFSEPHNRKTVLKYIKTT